MELNLDRHIINYYKNKNIIKILPYSNCYG